MAQSFLGINSTGHTQASRSNECLYWHKDRQTYFLWFLFDGLRRILTKSDAEPSRTEFKRTNRGRGTTTFSCNIKIGSNGSGSQWFRFSTVSYQNASGRFRFETVRFQRFRFGSRPSCYLAYLIQLSSIWLFRFSFSWCTRYFQKLAAPTQACGKLKARNVRCANWGGWFCR